MAKYNEILVGRFNRGLQKLLAIKGDAPVAQVAGEITPVISIHHGVENRFIDGWNRFAAGAQANPAVGNVSPVRFRNPFGSNVVAVLEKIQVSTFMNNLNTTMRLSLGGGPTAILDTGDLANAVPSVSFDTRWEGLATCKVSQQSVTATNPGLMMRWALLINTVVDLIQDENQEIQVLPGTNLQVENDLGNMQNDVSFVWRERFLEDSERK